MYEILAPGNTPFLVALGLMLVMALLEIVSTFIGMGLSELVDSFLPEFDADLDLDIDGADGATSSGALVKLLSWFRIGEVPVIMLFIIFLTGFGLIGLCLQYITLITLHHHLPASLAALISIVLAIPIVRSFGGLLGKYMPKDETYAVSEKSFYGTVATITLGVARKGKPAQAKLQDKFGQTHYLMVEPDEDEVEFKQGDKTIIVGQVGAIYHVIAAANAALTEED